MSKLDESRHLSICGMGTGHFYRQDGKLFDMFTLEEVDPTKIPKPTEEISSICKFCGAKRGTAEIMHEHLVAKHGSQMEQVDSKDKEPKPKVCPHCGATKRDDAKEFEWQFSCDCYAKEKSDFCNSERETKQTKKKGDKRK